MLLNKYYSLTNKFKLIIIFVLIIILIKSNVFSSNNNERIFSYKWIVMTSFKKPNCSFIDLITSLNSSKIVIISNKIKYNKEWKIINSTNKNLIYLSIQDQINLGYQITKFLKYNSYSRKNIGYLYAIQHGAKEIYEIDEDILIYDINNLNFDLKNRKICYGIRNDSKMINPFDYFNENNIWPRGFRLNDIGNYYNNTYYILNYSQLQKKPLIFQGLINGIPDVDSIFLQTRTKFNIVFSKNDPLYYVPWNYVPINSKNTKYLYKGFYLKFIFIFFRKRK